MLIVTKKDGNPRFCVDYRSLNQRMKADRWLLPKFQGLLYYLAGRKVFSTLDLFSGYCQIRVAEIFKEKTTFLPFWHFLVLIDAFRTD